MKKKVRKRRRLLYLLGGTISLILILYPWCSNWYYQKHQSNLFTEYHRQEEERADADEEWEACRTYNEKLRETSRVLHGENKANAFEGEPVFLSQYEERLASSNGILCYVRIPALDLLLPVYHGDGEAVLQKGLGHIPETSLPVGGAGTHAAITGHSGMAGNRMFTDLENLKEGDRFEVIVLGKTLTYQIDQIRVVVPQDISLLQIEEGKDLVTLITCTPYGINSHRLLVRGSRIEEHIGISDKEEQAVPEEVVEEVKAESSWSQHYQKTLLTGGMIVLGLSLGMILYASIKGRRKHEAPEKKE